MVGDVELEVEVVDSETSVAEVVRMELGVEKFVGSPIKTEELRAPIEVSFCVDMGVEVDKFVQEMVGDVDMDAEDSETVIADDVGIELLDEEFVFAFIKTK